MEEIERPYINCESLGNEFNVHVIKYDNYLKLRGIKMLTASK